MEMRYFGKIKVVICGRRRRRMELGVSLGHPELVDEPDARAT